jgi:C-terminal processing protease CtpA/Prc
VEFNKIDLNNIEENALKELRTKVEKANAAVQNYDKVKEKVKKELNTMLSRLDKTSKMVKDRELAQEMFEDLKSAMESILAEVSTGNYFVISDEDKTALENAANTL